MRQPLGAVLGWFGKRRPQQLPVCCRCLRLLLAKADKYPAKPSARHRSCRSSRRSPVFIVTKTASALPATASSRAWRNCPCCQQSFLRELKQSTSCCCSGMLYRTTNRRGDSPIALQVVRMFLLGVAAIFPDSSFRSWLSRPPGLSQPPRR